MGQKQQEQHASKSGNAFPLTKHSVFNWFARYENTASKVVYLDRKVVKTDAFAKLKTGSR